MKKLTIVALFLQLLYDSTYAQTVESCFLNGIKLQTNGKMEKALKEYQNALNVKSSNPETKELFLQLYCQFNIANIIASNPLYNVKKEMMLTALFNINGIYENAVLINQRKEMAFISELEKQNILIQAKNIRKKIFLQFPELTPVITNKSNQLKSIGSLGLEIIQANEYFQIKSIVENSASAQNGVLKPGDILIEISDGENNVFISLFGLSLEDLMNLLSNEVGSVSKLKVASNGQIKVIELIRVEVIVKNNEIKQQEQATNNVVIDEKESLINSSQNDPTNKTVTLTVSGQGKTKDEAQKNALRSAIEQAFGTFISSKTEILNDNLVKDEIVSVTNGNIQKFDIISEIQLPNNSWASTLKATVSISKLTTFCESKGVVVEFNGATFAMNIKLQKLNEESEYKTIKNLCLTSNNILSKSLDYSLAMKDPQTIKENEELYSVDLFITAKSNQNYILFLNNFLNTIKSLSMSEDELQSYQNLNKDYFKIAFIDNQPIEENSYLGHVIRRELKNISSYCLRNKKSMTELFNFFFNTNKYIYNIKILSEADTINCSNFYDIGSDGLSSYEEEKYYKKFTIIDTKADEEEKNKYADIGQGKIDEGTWLFIKSFPNNVFDRVEELSSGIYYRKSSFFDQYINYKNHAARSTIQNFVLHDSSIFEENNKYINKYIFNISNTNEVFPYKYRINRRLTLKQLEKITKYKIEIN